MSKKALIHNNKIIQISDNSFGVHPSMIWIDCPGETKKDWVYDGETKTVSEPLVSFDSLKEEKLSKLASYRYKIEVAGLSLNSMTISTDRQAQALIHGARTIAESRIKENDNRVFDFKTKSGWVELTSEQIVLIADAVGDHVQACFTNEKYHGEKIKDLLTSKELEAYDYTSGWPS